MRTVVFVALVLVGCGSEGSPTPPPQDAWQRMSLWPLDLETGTNAEPAISDDLHGVAGIMVRPPYTGELFEQSDLTMLSRALSVVTWPERESVRGRVVYAPGVEYRIEFVPDRPLESRWYAVILNVEETAARYSTSATGPQPGREVGEEIRRFYAGSRPILYASLARSAELPAELVLGSSESLVLREGTRLDEIVHLAADGIAVPCVAQAGADELLRTQGSARLDCSVDTLDRLMTLQLDSGLRGTTGVPLRDRMNRTDRIELQWNPAVDGSIVPQSESPELFTSDPAGTSQ